MLSKNGLKRCPRCTLIKEATHIKFNRNKHFADGFNPWCKTCTSDNHKIKRSLGLYRDKKQEKIYRDTNRKHIRERNQRRELATKIEVFNSYGGFRCSCLKCPETSPNNKLYTIDHINGGGIRQREKLGIRAGRSFYLWLKKNDYPPGYQVLCWNCNCGRSTNNGICPHMLDTH